MAHPPQRILIVLRRLAMGGIEQASLTLANAMAREGHEVHLLVLKGSGQLQPDPAVTVHCCHLERRARRRPLGMLWNLCSRVLLKPLLPRSGFVWQGLACGPVFHDCLQRLEAEHGRFDLVLVRGQGAYELLWTIRDPRLWLVVEAVTGHFGTGPLGRFLLRRLYRQRQLVMVSHGVEQALLARLHNSGVAPARHRVIHNAVPLALLRQKARAPCRPAIAAPYLVHVARLVPVKNQALLLQAYALARGRGLDMPLVLIGDGSQRAALQHLADRLDIAPFVHFLGQQDNPFPWVAAASALVLSSRFEGLGLVLIEALALGTQCVATRAPGGIAEVLVGEQQRLLAEPTAESLADKMLEAITHPVTINPEWVERFSEPRIVRAFLDLIPLAGSTELPCPNNNIINTP
jgi:glycosyltransferase involved in cell wall biosynthesis